MLPLGFRSLALLAVASLFAGCDVGDDCKPIDCQDGVWVVAQPSGSWRAGDYELEVTHDGKTDKCGFSLPYLVPTSTLTTYVECGEVHVNLYAQSSCTDCSLDGPFELDLYLDALPEELSVQLTLDGEVVSSDERKVDYKDIYPRGEECGGGCTQARLKLDVQFAD